WTMRRITELSAGLSLRLGSQGLAGVDRHLDTTVLSPAVIGLVVGDGFPLAHAQRLDAAGDALRAQVAAGGGCAPPGEAEVVGVAADRVGMADDHEVRLRVRVHARRERV